MSPFRRYLSCAIAAAALLGLGATPVSAAKPAPDPSQFTVGTTTVADVERVYGTPSAESVTSDGEHILSYSHTHSRAKATSFIPIVGLFAGGAVGGTDLATFIFDKEGHLKSYSSQTSNIDCKVGITGANCASAAPHP